VKDRLQVLVIGTPRTRTDAGQSSLIYKIEAALLCSGTKAEATLACANRLRTVERSVLRSKGLGKYRKFGRDSSVESQQGDMRIIGRSARSAKSREASASPPMSGMTISAITRSMSFLYRWYLCKACNPFAAQ
jgi:hypothetical protein